MSTHDPGSTQGPDSSQDPGSTPGSGDPQSTGDPGATAAPDRDVASASERPSMLRRVGGPLLVVAVVGAAVVIGLASDMELWGTASDDGDAAVADGQASDAAGESASGPARLLGDPDAPATIIEYSDFACPFCQAHHEDTFGALVDDYVDAGDLRYVWRDFPVQGRGSERAAAAGMAAAEQGGFWELHSALFEHGVDQGIDAEDLGALADEVGLDGDAVEEAVASDAYDKAIAGEVASGQSRGVSGTPAFVIFGGDQPPELLAGAQPLEQFRERIERRRDGG